MRRALFHSSRGDKHSMNDAFRALTTGVKFNKRPRTELTKPTAPVASSSKAVLPAELDLLGNEKRVPTEVEDQSTPVAALKGRALQDQDYAELCRKHKIKYTFGQRGFDDGHEEQENQIKPVASFEDLASRFDIPDAIKQNWRDTGFEPSPVQMAVWPLLADSKRDVLCCAPTGSGKTLAFVIPLLSSFTPPSRSSALNDKQKEKEEQKCAPHIVILEPTRELAVQVSKEALKFARNTSWSIQGPPVQEHKPRKKNKKNAQKEDQVPDDTHSDWPPCDFLVTTPLRLIFAIKSGKVDMSHCRHLILDESDQLFELNFVTQTDEIIASCTHPEIRKGMFSATLPSAVEELARSVMKPEAVRVIVGHKDSATSTISQSLVFAGSEDHKLLTLRSMIAEGGFTPPVLIFVQSIVRAKELATALAFEGINASAIHADLTPSQRDSLVNSFARGETWSLIATDVMARGLDFEKARIELVINYDLPQSAHSYIHRIGRTGRAGRQGRAVTFFTRDDAKYVRTIVNVMRASGQDVPEWMIEHLPKPSKKEKKQVKLKPVKRKDVSRTIGAGQTDKRDRKVKKRKRVMGGEELRQQKKQKVTVDTLQEESSSE